MHDNYICGAFAARKLGVPKELPMIPWAAYNKSDFPGLQGEIGLMRYLIWAGYDINESTSSGATALHLLSNLKWGPGCHARGIKILLRNGANPNIQAESGDTPLTTLCGAIRWSEHYDQAFRSMMEAGADPTIESGDGETPFNLLQTNQKEAPSDERAILIGMLRMSLS
jgi:ankyrin repeat protein